MKRLLVLLLVLVPALLLVFVNAVYSAPPEYGAPWTPPAVTLMPSFTLDPAVNIPDPALHTKLHAKTGIPLVEEIHASDLKALTGTLDLHGLGIANAEGLQYCKNVEKLNLANNDLTACGNMPDFSHMDGLHRLDLSHNDFTTVPSEIFGTPNLENLWMHGCPITGVDLYIADLVKLKELDLSDTDMTEFPIALLSMHGLKVLQLDDSPVKSLPNDISHMTDLEELHMQNTGLESIPSSISWLTNLKLLNISHNKLESLPDTICSLDLDELNVSHNSLYDLPAEIGSHVGVLLVQCNRLTSIPQSIISSPAIDTLNIMANRLTSLPSGLAGKTFDGLNVGFNFLDVSPGSPAREIMEDNESSMKYYLDQLTPVKGLTAAPSPDSVTLSWDACPSGSNDDATWTVERYVVYQYTGSMVKISDVDKSHTSYTHTGLTPETEYSYRVGVDYRIVIPVLMIDYTNRGYTAVNATTLSSGTPAEASPLSPAEPPAISPSASADILPAAQQTNAAVPGNSLPAWAIIIAAAGALGIVGTGVALVVLKAKKPRA